MNRRDAFKLFVAGTVSLLGMKGLAETLRGPQILDPDRFLLMGQELTVGEVRDWGGSEPVMGEQAHWPQDVLLTDLKHDGQDWFLPRDWRVHRVPMKPEWSVKRQQKEVEKYRNQFFKHQCFVGKPIVTTPKDLGVDIFIPDESRIV